MSTLISRSINCHGTDLVYLVDQVQRVSFAEVLLSAELTAVSRFQVPPSELEDLLLKHPSVVDAAVTSIYSDEQATELPIAYVTLAPSTPTSEKQRILNEIRAWADRQVAGYKKLRGGVFELASLPKTPSGKILRRELPCKKTQAEGRAAKL
jgi:4-coumarate--CoA ligase